MPRKKSKLIRKTKMPPLGSGMIKKAGIAILGRKRKQAEILKKLGF